MKLTRIKAIAILAFNFVLFFSARSQSVTYQVEQESKVSIHGTSTLHAWEAVVNEFEGSVEGANPIDLSNTGRDLFLKVELKFQVNSIDGGRGASMNKKILTALKSEEHPSILYKSTQPVKLAEPNDSDNGSFIVRSKGELTIAGVSRQVEIELEGTNAGKGTYLFKGKKDLKMSDFNIEPPTAMFGQIVTGDDITVEFELRIAKP